MKLSETQFFALAGIKVEIELAEKEKIKITECHWIDKAIRCMKIARGVIVMDETGTRLTEKGMKERSL